VSEPPIHFRDFEQIKKRERFDEACVITRANFEDLIGDYGFDRDVKCQVGRKDTKDVLCGHDHKNGFVGRRAGGAEGLIGRDCADLYFKDHIAFAAKRSFVTRELAIDDLILRLQRVQHDDTFLPNVNLMGNRVRALREESKALLDDLPQEIHKRLRDMAKARSPTLAIAVRYMEKVEDERTGQIREKPRWVAQSAGTVVGIEIVERTEIIDLGKTLSSIGEAFDSLNTRRELGKPKLLAQLKVLESVSRCESRLARLELQYQSFKKPENLANLWLLSRNQANQIECLRLAARADGTQDVKEAVLKTRLQQIIKAIMHANSGLDVRPDV
jgi:hypothetical protein